MINIRKAIIIEMIGEEAYEKKIDNVMKELNVEPLMYEDYGVEYYSLAFNEDDAARIIAAMN